MKPIRLVLFAALGVVATIRIASPLTTTVVLGHSMEPTMRPGSVYVLDRGYYRSQPVQRGDVIVLRLDGVTYVKRVQALPGERITFIRFEDGGAGELLGPRDLDHLRRARSIGKARDRQVISLTIPPGHCFVMGDNSTLSVDSREFGPVPFSAILGRALL